MCVVQGKVVSGEGFGRKIGYPTLNLLIPHDFLFKFGVYVVQVWIGGQLFFCVMHFGLKFSPSGKELVSLEIYVLNFQLSLRVNELKFCVLKKIRDVRRFSNAQDLKKQIERDVKEIQRLN